MIKKIVAVIFLALVCPIVLLAGSTDLGYQRFTVTNCKTNEYNVVIKCDTKTGDTWLLFLNPKPAEKEYPLSWVVIENSPRR